VCKFSLPGHFAQKLTGYAGDSGGGNAEMLLDPNTWSEDGTVALAILKFIEDAEFLAYGQSASGSNWITIRVMHMADSHPT
jgi:prolyl oligopeptidase